MFKSHYITRQVAFRSEIPSERKNLNYQINVLIKAKRTKKHQKLRRYSKPSLVHWLHRNCHVRKKKKQKQLKSSVIDLSLTKPVALEKGKIIERTCQTKLGTTNVSVSYEIMSGSPQIALQKKGYFKGKEKTCQQSTELFLKN